MSESAIYEGWVRHRRHAPVDHAFRYRTFMLYLDLGELPGLLDRHPLWSARRPAPACFRRSDYLGDASVPLADAARDAVQGDLGRRPGGPVRLLTQVRYLGLSFNPVSFYFCFDEEERVDAVVAEVTNTPWGERHAYVLDRSAGGGRVLRDEMDKAFHVSPFLGMDQRYEWRVTEPGDQLVVNIENRHKDEAVFDATLSLHRRELDRAALTRVLVRYPPMSLAVPARIYLNALRLKRKGATYHPHPERST
ncbi:MAG: DUF1365 domain-containing protein [Thermoleophilaceae bacterium]